MLDFPERIEINDKNSAEVIRNLWLMSGRDSKEIAKEAGLGQNVIWQWTTGGTSPTISRLSWFLYVLGYKLEIVRRG